MRRTALAILLAAITSILATSAALADNWPAENLMGLLPPH
jgi:hypothetical protein